MSVDEEVAEHAHHAKEPFDRIVAATMAVIAAALAIVSVLAQHYNTDTVLSQQLASDQWSFYQGKDIRRYLAQTTHDSLAGLEGDSSLTARYQQDAAKYRQQADEIREKAREFEKERDKTSRLSQRFDFAEVFLEIAIVLSSLAILSKRKPFFLMGVGSALIGAVLAATAHWL